jgi:hypothetical protein
VRKAVDSKSTLTEDYCRECWSTFHKRKIHTRNGSGGCSLNSLLDLTSSENGILSNVLCICFARLVFLQYERHPCRSCHVERSVPNKEEDVLGEECLLESNRIEQRYYLWRCSRGPSEHHLASFMRLITIFACNFSSMANPPRNDVTHGKFLRDIIIVAINESCTLMTVSRLCDSPFKCQTWLNFTLPQPLSLDAILSRSEAPIVQFKAKRLSRLNSLFMDHQRCETAKIIWG